MEITYGVEYHSLVVHQDIPALDVKWRTAIKDAIEKKLMVSPEIFGKPLRRSLKGYRKLRVGDYRVVFRIQHTTIKILLIQHRKVAYQKAVQRLGA